MNVLDAITYLKSQVKDPNKGLPEDIFLYISCVTPLVNVDLLIQDEKGQTLLSYRNDNFFGRGWHIPGGIIRFRELPFERVKKVIETEIFSEVKMEEQPIEVISLVVPELEERSHSVGLLYRGFLSSSIPLNNKGKEETDAGYLKWFSECPEDLLSVHYVYKKYIEASK